MSISTIGLFSLRKTCCCTDIQAHSLKCETLVLFWESTLICYASQLDIALSVEPPVTFSQRRENTMFSRRERIEQALTDLSGLQHIYPSYYATLTQPTRRGSLTRQLGEKPIARTRGRLRQNTAKIAGRLVPRLESLSNANISCDAA